MLCLLVMAGGFPLLAVGAWAEDVPVRLEFARDGDTIVAAVRLHIPANYHAYAHEAGGGRSSHSAGFCPGGGTDAAGLVSRRSHATGFL